MRNYYLEMRLRPGGWRHEMMRKNAALNLDPRDVERATHWRRFCGKRYKTFEDACRAKRMHEKNNGHSDFRVCNRLLGPVTFVA